MSFSVAKIRERFNYINASEVPDLFALFFDKYKGLNTYEGYGIEHITTTLYSYYNLPKLTDSQLEDYIEKTKTKAMETGVELEPLILQRLGLESNTQSFKKGRISSTPDAFDGEEVVEIKTTKDYTKNKETRYLIQLAVQLYTTGKKNGTIHIAILEGTRITDTYKLSLSTDDEEYKEYIEALQELDFLIDTKVVDYLPNFNCKRDRIIYEILNSADATQENQELLTLEECNFLFNYKNGLAKKAKALDEKVKKHLVKTDANTLTLTNFVITNKTTSTTETEESVLNEITKKQQEIELLQLKLLNKDFKTNVRRSFDIDVI